jgi:hypothetical protein
MIWNIVCLFQRIWGERWTQTCFGDSEVSLTILFSCITKRMVWVSSARSRTDLTPLTLPMCLILFVWAQLRDRTGEGLEIEITQWPPIGPGPPDCSCIEHSQIDINALIKKWDACGHRLGLAGRHATHIWYPKVLWPSSAALKFPKRKTVTEAGAGQRMTNTGPFRVSLLFLDTRTLACRPYAVCGQECVLGGVWRLRPQLWLLSLPVSR